MLNFVTFLNLTSVPVHICHRLYINQPFTTFSRITFLYRVLAQFMLIVMGCFFYSSYDSKVTSGRTRSFRIVRFRENRNLTYGAINIAQHSYHVYNSDGILYRFWRNYTELTLRTAAQGSQHTIDYTYDVNKILTARAPRSYFKPPPNLHFAVDG